MLNQVTTKIFSVTKRCFNFWRLVIIHFVDVNGLSKASALAYQTLLSIVPLSVASFGLISGMPAFSEANNKIQSLLFNNLVAGSAEQIQSYLQSFAEKAAKTSAIGILMLLISAVMMIFTMEGAFNDMWGIKKRRHGLTAFLIYWALLSLVPILGAAALAVSVYIFSLPYFSSNFALINNWIPILDLLPFSLLWLAFSLLNAFLPNCPVLFRHAAVGGLVATIFFEVTKQAFEYYLVNFSSYTFVYGAIATVPVFLIWIYLCWAIALFGAAVTAQLGFSHADKNNA